MEMKEINYQECCISCDQHNGWICADKNCPAHPAHKKCENYKPNPATTRKPNNKRSPQ